MSTKHPDPIDLHVGGRVRMRRLKLGITQERLADQLGLTFQQVQKYEKGTNRISASRLQQLCQILGVPIPFFFEGAPGSAGQVRKENETLSPTVVTDFLASPDGHALLKAFTKINKKTIRRSIVQLVEAVAQK
jgi:transcriptional regulator with XRE-family HTH domain